MLSIERSEMTLHDIVPDEGGLSERTECMENHDVRSSFVLSFFFDFGRNSTSYICRWQPTLAFDFLAIWDVVDLAHFASSL